MEIFSIYGLNDDKLVLSVSDISNLDLDFIPCTLTLSAGCFSVICHTLYTSISTLNSLLEQLLSCYKSLSGESIYSQIYEENLYFTVRFDHSGHCILSGNFREDTSSQNILYFEIYTDQTYIRSTIDNLLSFKHYIQK